MSQLPPTDAAAKTDNPLTEDTVFQTDQVFTIAGGHFMHDTYSAFIAPLLPILQNNLGTNYALTGSLAVFAQLPSILNPFIGYIADKVSLRYFIILAPAVTATIMSSMGLVSSYFVLAMLLLAGGVSIAAFHAPAPAMVGRVAGNHVGRGMSIFMAAGELGRTVGPLIVVAGIEWFGLGGIWRLAIIGWLVSGILYLRLKDISAKPQTKFSAPVSEIWPRAKSYFLVLGWLMLGRVFLVVSLTTFLPLYMSDVNQSTLWLAAASLTILEGAGVIGALATGTISDRIGRRNMLFILLGVSPFLMLAFTFSSGWMSAVLLILLGLTAISPTPVLMASVQDQFRQNRAFANGCFLGINFLSRALGIWLVGLMADRIGLNTAFVFSAIIAIFSIPAVWFMPTSEPAVIK